MFKRNFNNMIFREQKNNIKQVRRSRYLRRILNEWKDWTTAGKQITGCRIGLSLIVS